MGTKKDEGKSRIELIDPDMIEALGHVMRLGAIKYADDDWRGLTTRRVTGAALRHVFAYLKGQDLDPEFGTHHLINAIAELQFAYAISRDSPELDNRYRKK